MLGPDLPHSWSSNLNTSTTSQSIVIQLNRELWQGNFLSGLELKSISGLLDSSTRGLRFIGKTRKSVASRIYSLIGKRSFDAFIDILSMLNDLSLSGDYELISSPAYQPKASFKHYSRINEVHTYVRRHFKDHIRLEEAAMTANMTTSAFCRYFKKINRRTFFEYVNEYRIGHACQLLSETDLSITEICFESGFQSISNFNKQFRIHAKTNPMDFRKICI